MILKQAKRKAPYIDLDNSLKKCLVYGTQVKRKAGKLGKSLAKDKNTENLGKSSQQERIIDRVSEMKTYHEWASKRDNEIFDKTIDQAITAIKEGI